MEDESPEKLVSFVKTATDSVQNVLKTPLSGLVSTPAPQKAYRRRRLKKGLDNTLKKLKIERQHQLQQYEVQEMYTSSMLNAAPICFGDNTALYGIINGTAYQETSYVTSESHSNDIYIPSTEHFLDSYIPKIGSPRENKQLSSEIYGSVGNSQLYQSPCMFEMSTYSIGGDYTSPPEAFANTYFGTVDNEKSGIQIPYSGYDYNGNSQIQNVQHSLPEGNYDSPILVECHQQSYAECYTSQYGFDNGCLNTRECEVESIKDLDIMNDLVDDENFNADVFDDILSEIETTVSNSFSTDSLLSGFESDISSDRVTALDDGSAGNSSSSDSGLSVSNVACSIQNELNNSLPSFSSVFM